MDRAEMINFEYNLLFCALFYSVIQEKCLSHNWAHIIYQDLPEQNLRDVKFPAWKTVDVLHQIQSNKVCGTTDTQGPIEWGSDNVIHNFTKV